jgi:hypothetical protein
MQLMVPGDKWELYIPSDLGYGDQGAPPDIGPGDALIFTLHLMKLNGPGKALTTQEIAARAGATHGRGRARGRGRAQTSRGSAAGELR